MIYSSVFDGIQLQLPGGLVLKALLSIVVVKGHMLVFLTVEVWSGEAPSLDGQSLLLLLLTGNYNFHYLFYSVY